MGTGEYSVKSLCSTLRGSFWDDKYLIEILENLLEILEKININVRIMMKSKPKNDEELLNLAKGLTDIYEMVHRSNLGTQCKLFFEFYIGLFYVFRLLTLINLRVFYRSNNFYQNDKERIQIMVKYLEESHNEWDHLRKCKDATMELDKLFYLQENLDLIQDSSNQIWNDLHEMNECNYELYEAIKLLSSLRYLPKTKKFLTLAQNLHWKGFGNSGEWLPSKEDPYEERLIDVWKFIFTNQFEV